MAQKNKNHHLYADKVSGVWYFQKKIKGQSKPYKFSLETKSVVEARNKRDEYIKQIELVGHIPKTEIAVTQESEVFGKVAQLWAEIVKTRIAETTFNLYRKLMNIYILPEFGNKPIDSITSLEIEIFISKLKMGNKAKLNIMTPFRLVMKFAKKHKYIELNPFDDVEAIKITKKSQTRALSLDEIKSFINELDDFWKPLFIVMFFSGMRIAEASALKWKDVCFQQKIIKIRRNLIRIKGGKIIYKKPKTDGSIRDVKVPEFVIEALRKQRKQTWKGNGDNFVFLNKVGRPIHPHTLNNIVINPTIKKIGIKTKISLKDTRASYITNSLDQNERMSFIQKQVGHTTTRMIVDHYYRYVPAKDDGSRLENVWNSTSIVPDPKESDFEGAEKIK